MRSGLSLDQGHPHSQLSTPGTPAHCTESHQHVLGEPTVRIYETVLRTMRVRTPLGSLATYPERKRRNRAGC